MTHRNESAVGPLLTDADLPIAAITDPERREWWRIRLHNRLVLCQNAGWARFTFDMDRFHEHDTDTALTAGYRQLYDTLIEERTLDFYDALQAFEAEAGIAGETVEIMCPFCGRRQTVERRMWAFSVTRQQTMGFEQRGHPYTCSGNPEDSHQKAEMQRRRVP